MREISCFCFLLVFLVTLSSCSPGSNSGSGTIRKNSPSPEKVLADFSAQSGIKFPTSTRLINSDRMSFQDTLIWLKAEMDRKDLEEFMQNSPFNGKKFDIRLRLGPLRGAWWDPDKPKQFERCKVDFPDGKGMVDVMIDLDDSEKVVVYLVLGLL